MVQALRRGACRVGVHKQRAHVGQRGNELADGGAKEVAVGKMGYRLAITRAKKQLRERVTNWLASHRGYKCT
eukprot:2829690-Pyramimonas_sp.AAC.1